MFTEEQKLKLDAFHAPKHPGSICVANYKGGVGKTTLVCLLGYYLAEQTKRSCYSTLILSVAYLLQWDLTLRKSAEQSLLSTILLDLPSGQKLPKQIMRITLLKFQIL